MATNSFKVTCGAVLLAAMATGWAGAQEAATAPTTAPASAVDADHLARNWRDFIHYLRIARTDAALSYAQAILTANPDPAEVYRLSVQTENYVATLQRAERQPELKETLAGIRKLVEEGYKKVNRDPEQIAQAIDMLAGSLRQTMIGSDRLLESGQYAVPQLIAKLEDPQAPLAQKDRIEFVLSKMGKPAVRPLCAALGTPRPEVRIIVARSLGKIGYWHAAPYLRRLLDAEKLQAVKAVAHAALAAVTGDNAAGDKPSAAYFGQLAERYYTGQESIRPDSRYDTANVWYWQEGLGLTYREAPTAIFLDVYAMRSARQALEADSNYSPAVSLWLAANLRKESRLPAGASDPTLAPGQQAAEAYAKAAGARYMQDVLARALRDADAAVARGAIAALAGTAGADNLVKPAEGGVNPLVSALSFPDRQVRFMAAEALASARPLERFAGDEMVVTVLIDALRQTGKPTVLLIEPDVNTRNTYKELIRQAGFDVVDGGSLAEGVEAMRRATGVDLAVIGSAITGPGPGEALGMLRAEAATATLPVLFVARESDLAAVRRLTRDDKLVTVVEAVELDLDRLQSAMRQAAGKGQGGGTFDEAQAAQWALKAARIIRVLGLTRTPAFDLNRAERALVAGLADPRTEQKVACAEALAVLDSPTAQQAIVELARSDASEPVRISAYQCAAESVRLFGNRVAGGQADAVIKTVMSDASAELRDAASQLLGALDLPSQQIKTLITTTATPGE